MVQTEIYCHVVDGKYTRIKPCGLQRSFRGDGVAYFEADYLFGVWRSVRHELTGAKVEEVLLGAGASCDTQRLLPQWAIGVLRAHAGISSDTVEGRQYEDYSYAKREGEMVCLLLDRHR